MTRAHNFCAGPASLPTQVLEQAQQEMLDWRGRGVSVMEMSHRSADYMSIANEATADLRELLNVPENYKILFMQGGATAQFAMLPLNLMGEKGSADYINTGIWSKKAIAEAKRYIDVNIAADANTLDLHAIPDQSTWTLDPQAAYVHYTPNETIGGLEFDFIPDTGDVPLVADMSSTILSRELDVSRFGVIYAGAQKNIGPAGVTLVIIREDLLARAAKQTPTCMNYSVCAENDSMYNTPPTYSWYLAGLVFKWLQANGGLAAMAEHNKRKQEKLYAAIDASAFYNNPIDVRFRSWMNVPFTLADDGLNASFLTQAEEQGLLNLKGHRSVGGMRASIYNAIDEASVDALIAFMAEFEKQNA